MSWGVGSEARRLRGGGPPSDLVIPHARADRAPFLAWLTLSATSRSQTPELRRDIRVRSVDAVSVDMCPTDGQRPTPFVACKRGARPRVRSFQGEVPPGARSRPCFSWQRAAPVYGHRSATRLGSPRCGPRRAAATSGRRRPARHRGSVWRGDGRARAAAHALATLCRPACRDRMHRPGTGRCEVAAALCPRDARLATGRSRRARRHTRSSRHLDGMSRRSPRNWTACCWPPPGPTTASAPTRHGD